MNCQCVQECIGSELYECLLDLQKMAPRKYGRLLEDVARIRCEVCADIKG